MAVAAALAFAGFIALFGWSGALLALWPSLLIGAGGTLAVVQLSEMTRACFLHIPAARRT